MGISLDCVGFTVPLLFMLWMSWRAYANRGKAGCSITLEQWTGGVLLLIVILVLVAAFILDIKGTKDFVVVATVSSRGGVQVLKSLTGQLIVFALILLICSSQIKKIKMLPTVFYTWPMFLAFLSIDFVGCSTYVERYGGGCVIGGAGLYDGLMYIIPIHLILYFLGTQNRNADNFVKA